MVHLTHLHRLVPIAVVMVLFPATDYAVPEKGILVLSVINTKDQPVANAQLATRGDGSVAQTDVAGRARLKLAAQTQPGSSVSIILISPANLAILSPWERRVIVPSFDNETDNYASVVLCPKGDREALKQPKTVAQIAARVNGLSSGSPDPSTAATARRQALEETASQLDFEPSEIETSVVRLGQESDQPYHRGVAALFSQNYSAATENFRKVATDPSASADAQFFLGQAYFEQGKFEEARQAYERANAIRANDPYILNNLGLSELRLGNVTAAEKNFRDALRNSQYGSGSAVEDTPVLNNFANLALLRGESKLAKIFAEETLRIRMKALRPDDIRIALSLNNVAAIALQNGDIKEAETLLDEALRIAEQSPTPVGRGRGSLAAQATASFRAAPISLGGTITPGRGDILSIRANRAMVSLAKGDLAIAEKELTSTIVEGRQWLGAQHADLAPLLADLGAVLTAAGKTPAAQAAVGDALRIQETSFGERHPALIPYLSRMATVYLSSGRPSDAVPYLERAIRIGDANLSKSDPQLQTLRAQLAAIKK